MKILVAYDGSVCGDGALYDLASAGLPALAEIQVLTIADPAENGGRAEAEAMADRACQYLASRFPGWKIRSCVLPELPAQGILSQAEAWKPDLIVMGSHGRSSLGRMILGSASQKVLLHSLYPVRIARARIGADPCAPRLLVGMDGSPGAFAAVAGLAARHWPEETQVRLVAVVETRGALAPHPGRTATKRGQPDAWIGKRLKEAAARLMAKGITVTTEIRLGEPRRVILQEAKSWQAHGIYLGSRGLNPFQRFLMGSVSSAVAFHATCSVEVFRRANRRVKPQAAVKQKRAGVGGANRAERIAARIRKRIPAGKAARAGIKAS